MWNLHTFVRISHTVYLPTKSAVSKVQGLWSLLIARSLYYAGAYTQVYTTADKNLGGILISRTLYGFCAVYLEQTLKQAAPRTSTRPSTNSGSPKNSRTYTHMSLPTCCAHFLTYIRPIHHAHDFRIHYAHCCPYTTPRLSSDLCPRARTHGKGVYYYRV